MKQTFVFVDQKRVFLKVFKIISCGYIRNNVDPKYKYILGEFGPIRFSVSEARAGWLRTNGYVVKKLEYPENRNFHQNIKLL